ncbi:hypothetical protein L6452_36580 [Arctium lappa]|uniref:Uncharacterized protein n=1 Tax=Arctium lappa TaxID=4217 RepID=A0ACB8Y9R4_ARCLA|nr:hypothetical protein L6452_36580 [Arctium lappa]
MDDPSKSPHSHPGSASDSTENNPPEPPSHGGGSSTTKRKITTTSDNNEPEEEDNVGNITHLFTPTKRHQIESSVTEKENKQDTTTTTIISPWIREEINLLKDILDFYHKNGRYPYADMDDQQDFFKNWVQERGFYRDEMDLNMKMGRLKLTFLMNMEKKSNGEDVEAMMDPTDIEIFRLSNRVWGRENDHDDGPNDSFEDESGYDDPDVVDTKDLSCKDSIKEDGMISGHGSNCSSSKDSSSNENEDGSSVS